MIRHMQHHLYIKRTLQPRKDVIEWWHEKDSILTNFTKKVKGTNFLLCKRNLAPNEMTEQHI